MTKDSGLHIRVQRDLRDRFLDVCRAQDKPAAQVLREFIRKYVDRHEDPSEALPRATDASARILSHDN